GFGGESVDPPTHGVGGDRQTGRRDLSRSDLALSALAVREEGEGGTRRSQPISIVEVVGARVVEVDGDLHQPEAEDARVKIDVGLRIVGDGGHVVDAQYLLVFHLAFTPALCKSKG